LIKKLRRKLGLTQTELARRAGIKQGVLSYIENGRTKHPRVDTLAAIAAALGVRIEDLMEKKAG
jgi:transcriptional regulator with XRE-family HTH domain